MLARLHYHVCSGLPAGSRKKGFFFSGNEPCIDDKRFIFDISVRAVGRNLWCPNEICCFHSPTFFDRWVCANLLSLVCVLKISLDFRAMLASRADVLRVVTRSSPRTRDKPKNVCMRLRPCSFTVITDFPSHYKGIPISWTFAFFEPLDNSKKKSFPSPQSDTVILPSISRTLRFFEPIFVSLEGSKNWDSTVMAYPKGVGCKKTSMMRK